jgi:uncharacterized protein YcfL
MKQIFIIILSLFLVGGCSSKKKIQQSTARKNYQKTYNQINHDISKQER